MTSGLPTTRPQTVRIRFVRTLFREAADRGQARPCGPWITYVRRVISLVGNLLNSFFVPNRFASGIKVVSRYRHNRKGRITMNSKQVVLITGSSTGFGRLFAETLARKGHTVFATMRDAGGRNAKNASEIRTLAEKESLPIHVLELDVTDDASVGRAVDAAVAKAGRIDVAINNAGYYLSGLAAAVTTAQAQRVMETNFLRPVRVSDAGLAHMRRTARFRRTGQRTVVFITRDRQKKGLNRS